MAFRSGHNSNAKKLLIRLPDTKGDDELYMLNRAQIKALLSLSQSISWATRHLAFPDYVDTKDKLEAFADETTMDLMTPVDFCSQISSCADEILQIVTDALSDDSDTAVALQQAIKDMLVNDPDFITNIFNNQKVLPIENLVDTDSLDELWAQCLQIVDYTDTAIKDLIEILEVQSNNLEFIKTAMESIPFLKFVLDAVPVNAWLDAADYFLSVIGEQYNANYTETIPTGTRYKIACKLFCLCRDDKQVTVARIFDAIASLLSDYTTLSLENASELIESVLGINDNSELVVFATFGVMWGVARLSSIFGLSNITTNVLKIILEIAKDDASGDWETICEDCTEPSENCFNTGFTDPQAHYGTVINQTSEYIDVQSDNASFGSGLSLVFGSMPSGDYCHFDHHEFISGTFTPTGGNPDGFGANKWPSGTEEDINATDYDVVAFTYISSTAFTVRIYIG